MSESEFERFIVKTETGEVEVPVKAVSLNPAWQAAMERVRQRDDRT